MSTASERTVLVTGETRLVFVGRQPTSADRTVHASEVLMHPALHVRLKTMSLLCKAATVG